MTISSVSIKGIQVTDVQLFAVMSGLSSVGFSKADFTDALVKQGLTAGKDSDFVRRLMQHTKQTGLIDFDGNAQVWRFTDLGRIRLGKTLSLPSAARPHLGCVEKITDLGAIGLQTLACIGLIAALITLNASFAWELGREADQFRAAFVVGLMALDLMRPFLVAAGFALLARRRFAKALMGFAVAFMLSPVSVLSSTAILSSSFLLGAEMNTDEQVQTATLSTLRGEHTRRLAEAERLNDAWRTECDRGGCGPLAAAIEVEFLQAQAEAQAVLERIEDLTDATQGASDLLARMVVTFERLGIFGQGREILLPLFLAISLELGALFGPALLLGRRRSMP